MECAGIQVRHVLCHLGRRRLRSRPAPHLKIWLIGLKSSHRVTHQVNSRNVDEGGPLLTLIDWDDGAVELWDRLLNLDVPQGQTELSAVVVIVDEWNCITVNRRPVAKPQGWGHEALSQSLFDRKFMGRLAKDLTTTATIVTVGGGGEAKAVGGTEKIDDFLSSIGDEQIRLIADDGSYRARREEGAQSLLVLLQGLDRRDDEGVMEI